MAVDQRQLERDLAELQATGSSAMIRTATPAERAAAGPPQPGEKTLIAVVGIDLDPQTGLKVRRGLVWTGFSPAALSQPEIACALARELMMARHEDRDLDPDRVTAALLADLDPEGSC